MYPKNGEETALLIENEIEAARSDNVVAADNETPLENTETDGQEPSNNCEDPGPSQNNEDVDKCLNNEASGANVYGDTAIVVAGEASESENELPHTEDRVVIEHSLVVVGETGIAATTSHQSIQTTSKVEVTTDLNIYQQKKNLAQGLMDLALFSANANQLRYILETNHQHPYYYSSISLIGISLILQVFVGIGLIKLSTYNVNKSRHINKANKLNNWTVLGIFLITAINVFITSFGVIEANGGFQPSSNSSEVSNGL